jgi:hypothetical protein
MSQRCSPRPDRRREPHILGSVYGLPRRRLRERIEELSRRLRPQAASRPHRS